MLPVEITIRVAKGAFMRVSRVSRILLGQSTWIKKTLLAISAAAIIALPVTPIINLGLARADSASPYVTLSSFSGHPDVSLTVSGGNYNNGESIGIVATQNGAAVATTTTTADQSGQFSSSIQLPAKLAQGAVTITATGQTSGEVSTNSYYAAPFTPSLTTSDSQTTPYSTLTVSGSGYAPDETVDLNLAGATTTAQTDASGNFADASLTSPAVPAASYTLIGSGEASGASAVAYEYINAFYPSAAPSSYYVLPATSLGFTGSGFAPDEVVTVSNATTGATISSFTTDASGSFTDAGAFTVPASYAGQIEKFVLTGAKSNATTTTSATIGSYYPDVSPSSYYVLPGGSVGFNGSGFVPGETVDVYSGTTKLTSVIADSKGNLTDAGAVTIPPTEAGTTQTFTVVGETSQGSTSVNVQIGAYNPQASPSGYYLMPGSDLTFSGSGYAPGETVSVLSGLTTVASFTTDGTGAFSAAGALPISYSQANASVNYELIGSVSNQPIDFTIGVGQLNTQLTPSSYYVLPYAPFSVSATGFAPDETVTLTNGATVLATATTTALGTATFTNVSLPYSGLGSATLTATGTTSDATATATIGIGNYNATLVASNYYVTPGSTITLSGSGFAPNETVTITAGTVTQAVTADAMGAVSDSLVVPFGQTKNSLDITATGSLSHASTTSTITLAPYTPQVSPSTYYAQPGTPISFTGSGFFAGETISVNLNGTQIGTETADAKGNLASTGVYTLPYGQTAAYTLTGLTSGGSVTMNIGLAQFYAGLQLNSYYGDGGSSVVASGSGFAPNEAVTLTSGTTSLGSVVADATGSFSKTVTIPYAAPGKVAITATGSNSQATASTSYTVAQVYNSVELGSYAVPAGSPVTVLGSGFFAGEPVTVTTDRTSGTYTFDANAQGNLNDSGFVLPTTLAPGMLTLTFTGTESYTTSSITIYVQSAN
jgi:large repetitive protein